MNVNRKYRRGLSGLVLQIAFVVALPTQSSATGLQHPQRAQDSKIIELGNGIVLVKIFDGENIALQTGYVLRVEKSKAYIAIRRPAITFPQTRSLNELVYQVVSREKEKPKQTDARLVAHNRNTGWSILSAPVTQSMDALNFKKEIPIRRKMPVRVFGFPMQVANKDNQELKLFDGYISKIEKTKAGEIVRYYLEGPNAKKLRYGIVTTQDSRLLGVFRFSRRSRLPGGFVNETIATPFRHLLKTLQPELQHVAVAEVKTRDRNQMLNFVVYFSDPLSMTSEPRLWVEFNDKKASAEFQKPKNGRWGAVFKNATELSLQRKIPQKSLKSRLAGDALFVGTTTYIGELTVHGRLSDGRHTCFVQCSFKTGERTEFSAPRNISLRTCK